MPPNDHPPRGFLTFTLRWLLAAVAIMALPMAVMHYYVHGPEWFRDLVAILTFLGALVFVLCSPTLATLAIQVCQRRGRAAAIIVPVIVILIVMLALAIHLLVRPLGADR